MDIIRNVLTENDSESKGGLKVYFQAFVMLAQENGKQVYLVTCTKRDSVLESILEWKDVVLLKNGKGTRMYRSVEWQSLKTLRFRSDAFIFCLNLTSKHLEQVDDIIRDNSIIVAYEWIDGDCKEWADRWINKSDNDSELDETFPEALYKGLDWLSSSINIRIHHPLDVERIIASIKTIHKYIPNANLEKIKNTLMVDYHWSSDHANDFVNKIQKLRDGGRLQGGTRYKPKELYSHWVSREMDRLNTIQKTC